MTFLYEGNNVIRGRIDVSILGDMYDLPLPSLGACGGSFLFFYII